MLVDELRRKRVGVWGYGREGRAAVSFLKHLCPNLAITVLDDALLAGPSESSLNFVHGRAEITKELRKLDIVVKSPGISLYDHLVQDALANNVEVTSLLNLWFSAGPSARTICVSGTKGKSTTAALLAHLLGRCGQSVALAGNIGVPVSSIPLTGITYAIIEVSSYQAADFSGHCDMALLTSLSQEHIDWHRSLAAYYRDKLNLLQHAKHSLINFHSLVRVSAFSDVLLGEHSTFNGPDDIHVRGDRVWQGECELGIIANPYLARRHNASNLCAALATIATAGIDPRIALKEVSSFRPLPHRQEELGEIDGVLYVDDSISTTPEATIAALEAYRGRATTVLIGGFDRGIDYSKLVRALERAPRTAVVLLGISGERLYRELVIERVSAGIPIHRARSMQDAITWAREHTPVGGIVLLSPASPSYDMYPSYIARGGDFARCAGFHSRAAATGDVIQLGERECKQM